MNIIIKTKNFELTPALQAYITQRVEKLQKFLKAYEDNSMQKGRDGMEIYVDVKKETNHHRKGEVFCAEVMVWLHGKKLIAQAQSDDLGKAVTQARNEMEQEIQRRKMKMIEKPRRQAKKVQKEVRGL